MAPETLSLAGKTALVTGSSRRNGIGAAIAYALAKNGANVAVHYVRDESKGPAEQVAADLAKQFGVKTTIVSGKISSAEIANNLIAQILKDFGVGHIDILVNNQAAAGYAPLLEATQEQLETEFGVNVFSVIYLTQAVVKVGKIPQGGRIINIGSAASKLYVPSLVYTVTKAAQDALTVLFAGELGSKYGVTVNSIAPGPIPTDMSKPYLVEADGSPSALQSGIIAQTRGGDRLGTIEDIADAVLLLASEKSRWVTAQWISVSGGVIV